MPLFEDGQEDHDGRTKVLDRNLLLPCPFPPYAEKQSEARKGHTRKKSDESGKARLILLKQAESANIEVNALKDEEPLPKFTPNQLEQARNYFENLVNMKDSAGNKIHIAEKMGDINQPQSISTTNNNSGQN